MNFKDMTITSYLDELSARKSVPGGGSALALNLEVACALTLMCMNFSLDKQDLIDIETKVKSSIKKVNKIKARAHELIDLDGEAFANLMSAFKNHNVQMIEECSINAAEVPFELYKLAKKLKPLTSFIADKGNKNVKSDALIALDLIKVIKNGSALNIKANLSTIKNEDKKAEYLSEVKELRKL